MLRPPESSVRTCSCALPSTVGVHSFGGCTSPRVVPYAPGVGGWAKRRNDLLPSCQSCLRFGLLLGWAPSIFLFQARVLVFTVGLAILSSKRESETARRSATAMDRSACLRLEGAHCARPQTCADPTMRAGTSGMLIEGSQGPGVWQSLVRTGAARCSGSDRGNGRSRGR